MAKTAAIIVAAGRGTRAGGDVAKQYRMLGGSPVLAHTLVAMAGHEGIDEILVVIHPEDEAQYRAVTAALSPSLTARLSEPTYGGATRQASVQAGLEAFAGRLSPPDLVLVHDAARPFLSVDLIGRAIASGYAHGAAVPGLRITDTVKRVDPQGKVCDTPDRSTLRRVQTPQAFAFSPLLLAHRRAAAEGLTEFTDDGALAEWAGHIVHVFDGEADNMKITAAQDLAEAERRLAGSTILVPRAGLGYDVHSFGPGDHIWLGGLRIPHDRGVVAHSDGDVALHALTDAILGALADGDIGSHFPPSDPRWRGASSDRFLAYAVERLRARGGWLDHLDVTIVCEAPKVGPHREAMRARIAEIAGIVVGAVSVKATTSEGLGFTGRREGIAAQAIASIRLPG
ncbi:bifunctional 2-C-methyl-D-erythritol 4-phosphate cytidylyltransferase/2-C-methyl-D-erythritol 2,4-cyclodiphosphate synthase [Chelatococcus sp. GCM10030263]|uniref:bifunctional 2-C-methyl-D-erythritol 4-phosphate cytidylyltransferase/2-C-methyl-D-erythritol 2,4-cyclodiphosphate synthase n=1 Tax=Chelatococcus sp. GCM10030263 TaxID=3273387 RepID=UPI0036078EF7